MVCGEIGMHRSIVSGGKGVAARCFRGAGNKDGGVWEGLSRAIVGSWKEVIVRGRGGSDTG